MLLLQLLQRSLQRLRHKPMWAFLLLILLVVLLDRSAATGETEAPPQQPPQPPTTTPEPDASPGCKAPDIRFSIVRPDSTTEPPYAKFETTQLYLPEDYTTADEDFVERINIDLTGGGGGGRHMSSGDHNNKLAAAIVNPYEVDLGDDHHALALHTDDGGMDDGDMNDDDDDEDEDSTADPLNPTSSKKRNNANRRDNANKKRRPSGRRRRLENDNGESRGRGSRYRRQVQFALEPHAPMKIHHDPDASPETDKWSGAKLAADGDVYYVHIDDILKSRSPNPELRLKLHKLKKKKKKSGAPHKQEEEEEEEAHRCAPAAAGGEDAERCHKQKAALKKQSKKKTKKAIEAAAKADVAKSTSGSGVGVGAKQHHRRRGDSHEDKRNESHRLHKRSVSPRWQRYADTTAAGEQELLVAAEGPQDGNGNASPPPNGEYIMPGDAAEQYEAMATATATTTNDTTDELLRVKRKSGKTTGALSRPKGGGDSSSKTTSRKDKGIYDEEGGYSPVHPDETDSAEEEEESEEIDIHQQFTEVSEIRFPGEIGPLGDRRLCKIRCVKGKWVGPLCATNEEDENGNVNFQPLYKSCHVNRIPPHLLLSYRNISVTPIPSVRGRRNRTSKSTFVSNTPINVGWDLPHGHSLQARCKDIGLYKLLGESRVLCSNGLWAPRMPSCVPTTLLTNFSDDSAPSIRLRVSNGSGAFEPSGVLAVLPKSTIQLDCFYPRVRGTPEWTWTSWYMQYPTGWSNGHEDRGLRYRLTIRDIQQSDSGTFTCTSPRGLTNSIPIVVATSTCPQLPEPVSPLALRLEGNKLGQRAMYRCPPGYRIDGVVNATCLASGNWSSPPPTCQAVQCPRLVLDDPHLSLVELNTSAWGRAVFKCQWGFRLTGPPGLECEPTGVWSGPVPRCKAIQCPAKVPPLNGRIGGINLHQRRLTVGALITFSCNEGHTLVGEPSIICTETGNWSHEYPYCQSQCPYPGDPPNGLIAPLKFNYDSGDFLDVQCRPGFVLHSEKGPVERPLCQPSGNWSVEVPKCRSYVEV